MITFDNSKLLEKISTNEEFFFLAGQVSRYIMNQQQGANKTHSLTKQFLNVDTGKNLQNKILNAFKLYSHAIGFNFVKFNTALCNLTSFETNAKVKAYENYFLAGYLGKNMFYEKNERTNENEEK